MLKSTFRFFHNRDIGIRIFFRAISTTLPKTGKRNFRKFLLYNKRGTRSLKEAQKTDPTNTIPVDHRGVRQTGYMYQRKFVEIKEKIPEIIVPTLEGCQLKPYVSYRCPDVVQSEFKSLDLFNAVYAKKIVADFSSNNLKEDGSPNNPSAEEKLSPASAWAEARKTGSDIY